MGETRFPHGVSSFGVPILGTTENVIGGDVYWVGATAGSTWLAGVDSPNYGSKDLPFATIDYAVGKCTASNGDVIYVLPGHTETVTVAGGITVDIAGISIIGLGNGSNRPVITLSATGSTIAVSGANVTFKNLNIVAGVAEIVSVFNITAANCTLDGLYSYPNSTYCIKAFVLTSAAGDDLTIKNCRITQTQAPAATSIFIKLIGADRCRIMNNEIDVALFDGAGTTLIGGASTASLNVKIIGNALMIIPTAGGATLSVILMYAASTGMIAYNSLALTTAVLAGINNPANCFVNENYITKAVAKSGILDPVVS